MIRSYWFHLMFYSLVVYRLSLLLSLDTGPWHAISRFRSWLRREEKKRPALKKSDLAHGVECVRCSSIHVALAVAAYAQFRLKLIPWICTCGDLVMATLALSACAVLIHRVLPPK